MDNMFYVSTRGGIERAAACEAILKGIADNGGLYVPDFIPKDEGILEKIIDMDYKQAAFFILDMFFDGIDDSVLYECIRKAYDEKFDTEEISPVRKVGNYYFLELFHGPTLAFKDMALSILPHLLKKTADKMGLDKELVILTATSGDTGKAALEGFNNIEGIKVIVFFPEDGVSEIQKRQMTTHDGNNTFVVGISGNFDAAQNGVKDIFGDREYTERLNEKGFMLSSANSINIGRLFPQVVYYFYAYANLCRMHEITPGDCINAAVPTGNFGNILAAYYAKAMGLPIKKLICASNENRVLYDFFNSGRYDTRREFKTTISPSMDILISSNLERLLYMIGGNNGRDTALLMKSLKEDGIYSISPDMMDNLKDFYGGYSDDSKTGRAIKEMFLSNGYLMDTHTAVAYSVYKKYAEENGDSTKTIIVSTASPYKFTSAVMGSIDEKYRDMDCFYLIDEMESISGIKIPAALKAIKSKPVIHNTVCGRGEMKSMVLNILGL